jgi:hypothetical protein
MDNPENLATVGTQEEDKQNKIHNTIKKNKTTQWPKDKEQKDKRRSTKHTHKTN